MTEYGKAQIQALGAGLVGFVVVVGVGALLIFPHGKASVKAPVSSYAPVDVTSNLAAPVPVSKSVNAGEPQGEAGPPQSSPAPILPSDDSEETSQPAPTAAAPVAAPAPGAPKAASAAPAKSLSVTQHLDVHSSANSSAKAAVAAAAPASAQAPARKPMAAPKLDLSKVPQGSLASSVHYGVSDRSELMGRAAGPVYNFAGRNVNPKGAAPAAGDASGVAPAGGAADQVDAAQKQVDDSSLSDADKATINATLAKVKQSQGQ